ncbi:Uncharacterised protein [Vibrio cholerae]|uniref:Uncharacterized protein n=1 Tax=Vibrio cholerae TaxID=666 RepID=A0A655VFM3_VIBCL|nr:Uncharacterised protein [Vibrio cholerae]CSB68123.1 Uncharacterised protein [Vibrio cholerae]CSB99697.1 Uncharacterised protein [Vibrio cholerae]
MNLLSTFLGTASKLTDFIGDHGKTAALLSGTRGFNCRVEGEEVRLFGNILNHGQ